MTTRHLNILLADDDMDDCLFFKHALEELPLSTQLTTVHDGEQLMNYLSENSSRPERTDVLFLDINMPRKNGLECLSDIKRNPKLKNIPVVMFSTSNSWDSINMLFKSGSHVYIHKPSDFAQLKQVISHALPIAAEEIFSRSPLKYILNASNEDRPKQVKRAEK
ncbi:MAG TPA: response regulator [Chitinophagaceae bacterium]